MLTPEPPDYCFAQTFHVVASDIDELGHVNNIQYMRWIQEVARAHWDTTMPPGEREASIWVVREHHVGYRQSAFADQELRVRTWLGSWQGTRSQRFTRIERVADGVVLCEAESQWVRLDPVTFRPKVIEPEIVARLLQPPVG